MPNIFQLTTPDLIAILRILKPDIFTSGKISDINSNDENSFDIFVANNFSMYEDCKKLRSQITEWLLLNGYSTMHQFNKDPITDTWIIPNDKSRPVECGKYRVAQKVPIIIPDPLFDETPYLFNPIDDSGDSGFNSSRTFSNFSNDNNNNNLIKTKSATDRVLMKSFAPTPARHPPSYYKQTLSPMECQISGYNDSSTTNFKDPQLFSTFTISCQNNGTEKFIHLPIENSSLTSLENDMLPYCILQKDITNEQYDISKGFSYQLSLKELIENCVAKIKVAATLDHDYNSLISKSLNEGRLDTIIILLQNKAKKFCTGFEEKMLNDYLTDLLPSVQVMSKYFIESSVTGIRNKVLNVLKNVLEEGDYKEFENDLYKIKKLYNGAKLDNYYKNFYGKNHKIIDGLIYDSIDKKNVLKFMKELESKLKDDPRHEELRQFIINLYSIRHGEFNKGDISESDTFVEEREDLVLNKFNSKNNEEQENNEIPKNIDTIKISNSLKLE
ncbi:Hypothetical protein SRAE_2000189500 [Strongyloides ratti]|uniref:Uncharacterized protein n=1 Tax=Strongyloides ratti TaxID=34506 RepID=A0A090LBU4_STRRB|nr:Hypothetical protein SRAE_2000189500 [Strongyloides ratti]CEF67231.1 Hypothetical protein SRAE_2000189500 [Strongyloides ratti]